MPSEPETPMQAADESDEKQLCVSCMFPNEPETHFCSKCGAPLTSYAATGPFESIFAEGHVFRQASERPCSFIVVIGIWILFGPFALAGIALLVASRSQGFGFVVIGALLTALPVVMIAKTTRNYFNGRKRDEKHDA